MDASKESSAEQATEWAVWANVGTEWASKPVLTSGFLVVLDHSALTLISFDYHGRGEREDSAVSTVWDHFFLIFLSRLLFKIAAHGFTSSPLSFWHFFWFVFSVVQNLSSFIFLSLFLCIYSFFWIIFHIHYTCTLNKIMPNCPSLSSIHFFLIDKIF